MYSSAEYRRVEDGLERVLKDARQVRLRAVEPTGGESDAVWSHITGFVRDNRRIVYGGTSLNALLGVAAPHEQIYDDDDDPDLEFYSWKAMSDVKSLCDGLHAAGFKHVEAKSAVHDGTMSIYVNYQKYCDVTYLPRNLYNVVPFVVSSATGVRHVHPSFAIIDLLRVVNDPVTSGFRLRKDWQRLYVMQKYFFDDIFDTQRKPTKQVDKSNKDTRAAELVQSLVRDVVTARETLVVTGLLACAAHCSGDFHTSTLQHETHPALQCVSLLECVSLAFKDDVRDVFLHVRRNTPADAKVTYVEHVRFADLWGPRGVVCVDGNAVAIVYDNNYKCVPCSVLCHDKYAITSFAMTVMMLSIAKFWHLANGDSAAAQTCVELARLLCASSAGKVNTATYWKVAQDAVLTAIRVKMVRQRARQRQGLPLVFKYAPQTDAGTKDLDGYRFDNVSGNTTSRHLASPGT